MAPQYWSSGQPSTTRKHSHPDSVSISSPFRPMRATSCQAMPQGQMHCIAYLDTFVDDVVGRPHGGARSFHRCPDCSRVCAEVCASNVPPHPRWRVPDAFTEFAEEAARFWQEHASPERKAIFDKNVKYLDACLAAAPATRSFAVAYHAHGPLHRADPAYGCSAISLKDWRTAQHSTDSTH